MTKKDARALFTVGETITGARWSAKNERITIRIVDLESGESDIIIEVTEALGFYADPYYQGNGAFQVNQKIRLGYRGVRHPGGRGFHWWVPIYDRDFGTGMNTPWFTLAVNEDGTEKSWENYR